MVKEPIKRKSPNMNPVGITSIKRTQISIMVLGWFLMSSGFKVLIRKRITECFPPKL
jgi:hypothetical protein